MHRFGSTETDVDRDMRKSIEATRSMQHSQSGINLGTNGNYGAHNSNRSIHVSIRDLTIPDSPNKKSGNLGVQLGASANNAEGAVELMEDVPKERQIHVEYIAMRAWVPGSVESPGLLPDFLKFGKKKTPEDKPAKAAFRQILYSITGCCKPGEVLAFMGPSGSGKTTLLSIIGGRSQSMMSREGEVLFNGAKMEKHMKRAIGYVMQDDLLYESLTVFEVLWYAAQLRLPRHMSEAEKRGRVHTVISALGLDACKDTIVGGFFRKGISGGERKRCSVGHELLINPSLLLLDEPTSGLDSTTAMHLLSSLRKLAAGGRAIITTIHQPSSRLYQQLDKLLLLSMGHAMYYGRASEAVDWFSKMGYQLPYGINTADFILDLASADVSTALLNGEESRLHLIECFELYSERHMMEGFQVENSDADLEFIKKSVSGGAVKGGREGERLNGIHAPSSKGDAPIRALDVESTGKGLGSEEGDSESPVGFFVESRWGASYWTQFRVLLSRAVRVRRFQAFSIQDFSQFIILGVLAGLFWLQKGKSNTISGAQQTIGLLFFELLFLGFRALFVALFTFPEEYKMLLKERASGMYQLSAFYFARLASDIPLDMAIPTVFVILLYFIGGLRVDSAKYFFQNWFAVILVMLVCQSFGLLLGTVVMVPKTAQTIASVVMLTFVLTGGYFVQSIPPWISWMKYTSFIYYGFGLLLHIEYSGRTIYSCVAISSQTCTQTNPSNPANDPTCSAVPTKEALHLQQDPDSVMWLALDACILIGILIVIRFLTYIALRHKTSRM